MPSLRRDWGDYRVNPRKVSRGPVREGVWKCGDCMGQFTVTAGTVFHGSKIPLSQWLMGIYLRGDSANGWDLLISQLGFW